MAVREQLSVTIQNQPGALAKMCGALAEKNVNLLAFMSMEREGRSLVRMLVDKVAVAKRTLEATGYAYSEEQVLVTQLANHPGALSDVARRLGEAGINIDYAYIDGEPGSGQGLLVLSVSDPGRAQKLVE
jgi:hypothetical protein